MTTKKKNEFISKEKLAVFTVFVTGLLILLRHWGMI
jgi:hypothetical protein